MEICVNQSACLIKGLGDHQNVPYISLGTGTYLQLSDQIVEDIVMSV